MSVYDDPSVQEALNELQKANQKFLDAIALASGDETFDPWVAAFDTASKRCGHVRNINDELAPDATTKRWVSKQIIMNYMFPQK